MKVELYSQFDFELTEFFCQVILVFILQLLFESLVERQRNPKQAKIKIGRPFGKIFALYCIGL